MKKEIITLALCLLPLINSLGQILSVEGGKIEGVPSEVTGVTVYKGIPYAAPPIGELRWKQPQSVQPWEGVRQCHKFGAASLQGDHTVGSFYWKEFYQEGNPERSEDCLYLNVWTPSAAKENNLPVIFWIHGGGYMAGYGHELEFDGNAYANKGVILVTCNYRLGMCGFLAHPQLTKENGGLGSGNYGLFDQLAALKWVKNNIAAFGGNPNNITIMGQSAGAGSVQALLSSPLSKGLMQRAIIQSGGGLGGIIQAKSLVETEQVGEEMWKEIGINSLSEMRSYPSDKFQNILIRYMIKQKTFNGLPFGPCIDKQLLTDSMDDVAYAAQQPDIPYMIGYTSDDLMPEVMKKAAVDWSLLLENQGREPAYIYCFSRDLPGKDMPAGPQLGGFGDMKGAFHSAELWYTFGTLNKCWRPMQQADYELSQRMVGYWTNFAKYGNPNGDDLPLWEAYSSTNKNIQLLDIN